ncbi:MAG: family 10 glycosylhydrolase [Rhodothermales bacterium]|nr:family 10 glycosylhydrolase [Rhodothermales bacterium]MBO6779919.1 family 10 glycosylhydrolase [Rhodothermales bacterium]
MICEVRAQSPKHEFRGAWIATVINLDWPSRSTTSTSVKQAELQAMLDDLAALGVNSVMFQVRTECDALYNSPFEPWSVYLTGQQGRAPDPYFDPLEFAVDEAHARGMSLHAWLNPFRCEREVGRYALASDHPVVENPEWMLTLESNSTPGLFHTILNPGLDAVHDYVAEIVDDVLRRYDVDGIHFDDYFYPYPPYEMGSSDLSTFDANPRGFANLDDWRRDNINRFVARINSVVQQVKPDAVFGISPFGIWRSGTPQGIVGLSGADALFADARAWLDAGTVDYLAPQLYWPFGGGQDFAALADWWVSVSNGRHLYPGLAAYRADPNTAPGTPFASTEIPAQIRFGRSVADGHILFRTQNIRGTAVADSVDGLYARPAIPPPMNHRDLFPPDPVDNLRATKGADGTVTLEWDPSIFGFALARSFAVYRAEGASPPDTRAMTASSESLLGRAFGPSYTDRPGGSGPYHYVVTALSSNSAESAESGVVTVSDLSTAADAVPIAQRLEVWPNPFDDVLSIKGHGEITVHDALGRLVWQSAVGGVREWRAHVAPGVYLVRLMGASGPESRLVVHR